ncbi:MAG TPA: SDR family NAD(P)-dependent oxidoreductase [Pseudomonadales bacterium]|nr:SDR family NAD(P)-dependent oxidoreductase [Pseudomonadales bacterium]
MDQLEGRTAFITGGASGIGFAMAKAFAGAGMKVAIADVEQAALDTAVAKLKEGNADVLGILLDVRDRAAMDAAAQTVEDAFGPVHLLCNNAGVGAGGPMHETTHGDWDWTLGVNLNGVVNGQQSFLPRMVAHGEGGHVVNTASMAGIMGVGGMGPYNASKFAVVGISEALAQDVAHAGIGVSVLCPGFVKTNIFESERNRPADLPGRERAASEEQRAAMMEMAMATAISPEQVAEQVLEAVKASQFWIFTHPQYAEVVRARMESMMAAFPPLPEGMEPVPPRG